MMKADMTVMLMPPPCSAARATRLSGARGGV
eukprot:COSAG04_NODE_19365_length_418_cov_0.482759_1_plen_30_part_10